MTPRLMSDSRNLMRQSRQILVGLVQELLLFLGDCGLFSRLLLLPCSGHTIIVVLLVFLFGYLLGLRFGSGLGGVLLPG